MPVSYFLLPFVFSKLGRMVWLWFLFLFGTVQIRAQQCQTPQSTISALMDLYNSTNGPNWINNQNWGITDPCKNLWYGVSCGGDCLVYQLYLPYNRLVGTIPSSISKLNALDILSLYGNQLYGPIPSSLTTLTGLVYLYLNSNQLTGSIPPQIGTLPSLQGLFLQDNLLNGTVPFPQNPGIPHFNISNNQFSCPLPSWCSTPPVGNGLCSPCLNGTLPVQYCCLYSNNGCAEITASLCAQNSCPTIPSQQKCGQIETNDCSKCDLFGSSNRMQILD